MKKSMLTAVALGAAYLLRNKDSRQKLMDQFQSFTGRNTTETPPTSNNMPVTSNFQ